MCGINGFTFKDEKLILKMNELTRHRGPDQTATWTGDRVSLGHNRLAIIDLSERGNQPMWDAAREVVIVFNGEIYNYRELRETLQKKYQFQSESDTEVIIYAYKEYGVACFQKLNGIFALAILDTRTHTLILARDRIGVNPLYYYHDGGRLIFSSEIKAILAHPSVSRQVDQTAFDLYMQLLYVPTPYTMFAEIKKLPPATYAVFQGEALTVTRYWDINDFSDMSSRNDAAAAIRELFPRVVAEQLASDRPVGVFLSGGIDSTAVLGAVHAAEKDKIKTFSVGFEDSTDPKKFNADFLLARRTAVHYKTDHHELMIGSKDIRDRLEKIVWHLDEPNSNPTAGAMFLLSEMACKEVAVVLGGDGGDELFGGYPRYYYSRLISHVQTLPRSIRALMAHALTLTGRDQARAKLALPPSAERLTGFLAQPSALVRSVLSSGSFHSDAAAAYMTEKFFAAALPTNDFEKYFMHADRQSWLVDESLLRTNKMCMAFGLEPRVPILDYRMVALANRIPTRWKLNVLGNSGHHFQGKNIWRQAIAGYIPDHIAHQRKRGWFTPMAKWVRQKPLYDFVDDILSTLPDEYFNRPAVRRVWIDHVEHRQYNVSIIWAIVMWQLWHQRFIKNTSL